jgi:hypothetical protein
MLMPSSQLVLSRMNYIYKIGVTAPSNPFRIAPGNTTTSFRFCDKPRVIYTEQETLTESGFLKQQT